MAEWTSQQEDLLVAWAEKASGSAWLHSKSVAFYKHRSYFLVIPACILSYGAGMTSLSSTNVDSETLRLVVGIMGMLAGIFTSMQEIFPFKELSAQHRMVSLRFLSFFRDVSCELSIAAENRVNAAEYINMKRIELDKLHEQTPPVPDHILAQFESKFASADIHRPDFTGTLQTILPYGRSRQLTGAELVEVANSDSSDSDEDEDEDSRSRRHFGENGITEV